MIQRSIKTLNRPSLFAACALALLPSSALAAQSSDLVRDAARAIMANDVAALKEMRFRAYGLDHKPIAVDALLAITSKCIRDADARERASPRELHYECEALQDQRDKCDGPILIVSIDRATSPDVFAQLRFKRQETAECALPALPG
ncbi:hypothetical protein [Erythrobacter crassostreae]|uniref:UrcA family protein n=1 Tax=Erythrobacter crassostreae TaxID=2828328 RepID=A0A9X1F4X7_9SPHN|nr:hypothetical protein [Erythrobacter crassostrea]MBV7259939.1 hypothetical protein [Erythrobacter crassostrea]